MQTSSHSPGSPADIAALTAALIAEREGAGLDAAAHDMRRAARRIVAGGSRFVTIDLTKVHYTRGHTIAWSNFRLPEAEAEPEIAADPESEVEEALDASEVVMREPDADADEPDPKPDQPSIIEPVLALPAPGQTTAIEEARISGLIRTLVGRAAQKGGGRQAAEMLRTIERGYLAPHLVEPFMRALPPGVTKKIRAHEKRTARLAEIAAAQRADDVAYAWAAYQERSRPGN